MLGKPPDPKPPDPPAVVEQAANAAQQTAENGADAIEGMVDEVTQSGEETQQDAQQGAEDARESAEDAGADVGNQILQIGRSAENAIGEAGRKALSAIDEAIDESIEATQEDLRLYLRLLSVLQSTYLIIVAVFLVIVAVVVAAVTFGAASAMLSLLQLPFAGKAQSSAGSNSGGTSVYNAISQILLIIRRLEDSSDKNRARRLALMEIANAMRSIERATVSLRNTSGRCSGDMQAALLPLQRVDKSLTKLTIFLRRRRIDTTANGQAAIIALERVHRALVDTTGSLQLGVARLNQAKLHRAASGGQKTRSSQSQSGMTRGVARQGVNLLQHGLPSHLKRR
jgi:hypothetical protein